jgi:hypothetical protein
VQGACRAALRGRRRRRPLQQHARCSGAHPAFWAKFRALATANC